MGLIFGLNPRFILTFDNYLKLILKFIFNVYLFQKLDIFELDPEPQSIESVGIDNDRRTFALYDVKEMLKNDNINLNSRYKKPHIYGRIPPPSLQVSRFITGN